MEIMITDVSYVKDIQEGFQKEFPYLKLEFFKNPSKGDSHAVKSQPISGKMMIGNIRHIHKEGLINIDGNRSVGELETEFQDSFGLWAQVFRKSGNLWIETTLTEHWSLTRQNREGHQMS